MNSIRLLVLFLTIGFLGHAAADVVELDNNSLKTLQEEGVIIIDVRRPDEWADTGVIAGSHGITFFDEKGRYDVNEWLAELSKEVKPSDRFVLICAHGVRSSKIAELLDKRLGYSAVHNATKGMYSWLADGHAVESWTSAK